MTDIPGTITTAIREAIDAAVAAERERRAKIAESCASKEGDDWHDNAGQGANDIACDEIAAKIRFSSPPKVQMDAPFSTQPTGNIECNEPEGQHFDITAGTFVSNTRG